MEIARPQVSEKPPIPAKPRLRPAPPRPPKPPITASSTVSPTSSSTQINNDKNQSQKSCTLQNGLPNTLSPKHAISVRTTSAEFLSPSSESVSSRSQDLPTLQPSEQRKEHVTPSSSLSLPASFRNKNFHKCYTNSTPFAHTTLAPFMSSSPIIPTCSQRSPIRHVSPSRKVSSATTLKPKKSFTTKSPESETSGIVHSTGHFKKKVKQFSRESVQPPHTTPGGNTKSQDESIHLKTQTSSKPNAKIVPLRKNSVPPPERPTSPPERRTSHPERPISPPERPTSPPERRTSHPEGPTSPPERPTSPPERPISYTERPTSPPDRPTSPPSRSAPCAERLTNSPIKTPTQTASFKSSENLSTQAAKDIKTTDTESPVESKPAVPPPLPKNPPRGGVPRKLRKSSLKLTPTTEIRLLLGQHSPERTDKAHDDISCIATENAAQQIEVHSDSQPLVHENQSRDTTLLSNINSSDTSDVDTRLQHIENNITDNYLNKAKTRTPPKPRPRTRPVLSPNSKEGISPLLPTVDSVEKNLDINSIVETEIDVARQKLPESDYAEVYHEDPESLDSSDIKINNVDPQGGISLTSDQPGGNIHQFDENPILNHSLNPEQPDTNTCLSTQSSDVTSAILTPELSHQQADINNSQSVRGITEINSDSTFTSEAASIVNSSDSVSAGSSITNLSGIFSDSKSLFQEEPEATCGMLKEIEELLKNKLGDIELDPENSSAKYSQITSLHSGDSEDHSADETRTNYENKDFSLKSDNSSVTSPVRPPRPKRQASIVRRLGSQESLNTSSTECLVSSVLSENTDSGKKMIPQKPKRTFVPRVSRSHSDVTGMKSLVDSNSSPEDAKQPPQEEAKPFLPPRLESLKRSESAATSPPPLPPRNKLRSASLMESGDPEQEPPALPARISLRKKKSHRKTVPTVTENLQQSETTPKSASPATQSQSASPATQSQSASPATQSESVTPATQSQSPSPATQSQSVIPATQSESVTPATQFQCASPAVQSQSKVNSSARLRPARKAPPPPPSLPRRSATFSPGDNVQQSPCHSTDQVDNGEATQAPASPTVQTSVSACGKRLSSEVDDHCYHEISDSIKIREDSQENDESPPPVLPPRSCKADSEVDKASFVGDEPQQSTVKLSGDNAKYLPTETSEPPKKDILAAEVKTSSPKEQKQLEKMAKNALIQKVVQGLGLRKSLKVPKVPEITLAVNEPKKEPADDSESEKVSTSSDEAVDLQTDTKDIDHTNNIAAEIAGEFNHKVVAPADTSDPAVSPIDRPLNDVSQQSTGSDQEGSSQIMEEIVSSGTDTEPEEDKEEIYAIRKAKKVFFIANEIVSSERTFVDVLKLLNIDFRQHISRSTENLGHSVIPSETLNKILDYLPQLQNFNEDLLKDLEERIESWETNPRLADIFVKKGPFLKLYSSYIRNFESATAVLEDAVKKNSVFASTLKEFELSPRCAKLALKHYMLKPIQRIPQYKLLLQDYMKHLIAGSLDYKDTVTALNIVSEVADHANDSMRHGDNVQKLLEIQRSLIGQFEVIQPGRVLLKQGELQKLSRKEMQPRMFMLFNDVLLYTTPTTSGYKINNILPLTGMKINFPKLEDYKYEFNIISVQRSFTLSGSTSEQKEQWVTALQSAIEENAKKYHTFQTVKHGPQTSLHDKDFVLGHKAPLWVPDARVTMCMLCLLEFTLTWRRHHCRSCGRVVCSHCSENKAPLRYLKYEPARVCDKCFKTLREDMTSEYQQNLGPKKKQTLSLSEEDSFTSVSEGVDESTDSVEGEEAAAEPVKHDSGLSLNHLMSRFQKIRISNREKRKPNNFRPSVLKEVSANDEGSDMSGYLRAYRSRRWKRLWFVVKGKVLYTYKASEDMAATESMPLLGYEVTRMNAWFEGAEPDLLFELSHQNNQPLTPRKSGESASTRALPCTEKTTQRLIFRTDSAAATTKWVTVLREASLTYQ